MPVSTPDNFDTSSIICLGMAVFTGVGISPVNTSSASCQRDHLTASILIKLPLPNPNSSQKASAIIATLNECSATDCGFNVGIIVHRSTSAKSKAHLNLCLSVMSCL